MPVKVVAFDFDGVIVDSLGVNYKLYLKAFKAIGGHLEDTPEVFEQVKMARCFFKTGKDHPRAFEMIAEGFDFTGMDQEKFNRLLLENPHPKSIEYADILKCEIAKSLDNGTADYKTFG